MPDLRFFSALLKSKATLKLIWPVGLIYFLCCFSVHYFHCLHIFHVALQPWVLFIPTDGSLRSCSTQGAEGERLCHPFAPKEFLLFACCTMWFFKCGLFASQKEWHIWYILGLNLFVRKIHKSLFSWTKRSRILTQKFPDMPAGQRRSTA